MFNPAFETLAPITLTPAVESNLDSAFEDQYLAWRKESFGFLSTVVASTHSEVELEAARQLILDKDWEVQYSDFYQEAYAQVRDGKGVWTRLFKSDLRSEVYCLIGRDEPALTNLFNGLIDQIDEVTDVVNEREDRAYAPRSAGRFAKAS